MIALASDFDGTLYFMWDEEKFRSGDLEAIKAFQKKGGLFGICSGRSLVGIQKCIPDTLQLDFYILASGALILGKDLTPIACNTLPVHMIQTLYETYTKEAQVVIQANDTIYNFGLDYPLQTRIESFNELKDARIYGISMAAKDEAAAGSIAEEMNRTYPMLQAFQNKSHVDVAPCGCSKGKALDIVRESLGISRIGGIGDSFNDLPMLENADIAFTFPHVPVTLKEKADRIVETVGEAVRVMEDCL